MSPFLSFRKLMSTLGKYRQHCLINNNFYSFRQYRISLIFSECTYKHSSCIYLFHQQYSNKVNCFHQLVLKRCSLKSRSKFLSHANTLASITLYYRERESILSTKLLMLKIQNHTVTMCNYLLMVS